MINIIQNGSIFEISFPYDADIVSIIRDLPQRNYVPNSKHWVIPIDQLEVLMDYFKGTKYECQINVSYQNDKSEETIQDMTCNNIPDIDISNVKTYVQDGCNFYKHQEDFIKYALYRQFVSKNLSGFLLGDDPGLGKTLQGMNLALYNRRNRKFKHCLIICCVNSAKYNWIDDIEKHSDGKFHPYMLGSRKKRNGELKSEMTNADKLHDIHTMTVYGSDKPAPYFLLTNVEVLRYKTGKHFLFAEEVINQVNAGNINMIIIDEIHKNMSPSSSQGKAILKIKDKVGKKCMFLPMTGTPIVNRPTDVFVPLRLIDAVDCKSYYNWCQDFCISGGYGITDVVGYKNIPTLKHILQTNMLRRKKEDVLDLPPIIFNDRYVLPTYYQRKLYDSIEIDIREHKDEIMESMNPLAHLLRLRQVCGSPELVDEDLVVDSDYIKKNAKLQELMQIIEEIISRDEKVIIFSNWVKPLNTLYRFIDEQYPNSVCVYHGELSANERTKEKYKFTSFNKYKVLLGTIGAAGVSHTLTCAKNVIFYDEPFTYADKKQAWERAYRIGTDSTVNVYTLLTLNTVEERVHNIVYNKKAISEFMVDSIDIKNNPELFDYLLGK